MSGTEHAAAPAARDYRRVTYRLYPSRRQEGVLERYLQLHCELYNAAIEERREAWKRRRVSVSRFDQEKQLPAIKAERPELVPLGASCLQETIRRVDRAFQHFFRRVKAGQKPGYPRFKSWRRYKGWTYKNRDCWKLQSGAGGAHGKLLVRGIGWIRIRGRGRHQGVLKTCTITRKADRWYASIVVVCQANRSHGAEELGLDWGVENFLTLSTGERIENPRFERQAENELRRLARAVSRKRRGGRNRAKVAARLARLQERLGNRRANFQHRVSADLVATASLLATEELRPKDMTASAKRSKRQRGWGVRQKATLNRRILDTAPAGFLAKLRYKAEEAGIALIEVNTQAVKPSQTCPECGRQERKPLTERWHRCPCGCSMHRDQAAAVVCLTHAKLQVGNRPAGEDGPVGHPTIQETTSGAVDGATGGR